MNVLTDNYTDVYVFDIVDAYSDYLEGYILVPVGVLGIIGKIVCVHKDNDKIIRLNAYIFELRTNCLFTLLILYRQHFIHYCTLYKRAAKWL